MNTRYYIIFLLLMNLIFCCCSSGNKTDKDKKAISQNQFNVPEKGVFRGANC